MPSHGPHPGHHAFRECRILAQDLVQLGHLVEAFQGRPQSIGCGFNGWVAQQDQGLDRLQGKRGPKQVKGPGIIGCGLDHSGLDISPPNCRCRLTHRLLPAVPQPCDGCRFGLEGIRFTGDRRLGRLRLLNHGWRGIGIHVLFQIPVSAGCQAGCPDQCYSGENHPQDLHGCSFPAGSVRICTSPVRCVPAMRSSRARLMP